MIMHTGARVHLNEWGGTIKADVYRVGNALVLRTVGAMEYVGALVDCDYSISAVEDRTGEMITCLSRHATPLSDKASEMFDAAFAN